MRIPFAALAAAALAGLAAPAAQAQDTPPPVASVAAPTPIAAYAGRLVWSEPDGTGSYRLVQRIGAGPVQALPIAARSVPFDVDLGPTSAGTVYAVYSRCHVDPTWSATQMPAYEKGKGCDVYKLDLSSMTEVRYTKANASDGSEYWPSYEGPARLRPRLRGRPGQALPLRQDDLEQRPVGPRARRVTRLLILDSAADRALRRAPGLRVALQGRPRRAGL